MPVPRGPDVLKINPYPMRPQQIIPLLLVSMLSLSGQKTTLLSGNWDNPLIWLPAGAPVAGDNVTITTAVTITSNISCNDIVINSGAFLSFSGGTGRLLKTSGDILINGGGTLRVLTTSNAVHTVNPGGDLTINGTCNFAADNNSRCVLSCTTAGSQTISGNGSLALFRLSVNKGNNISNELAITVNSLSAISDFLTLGNGTWRKNGAIIRSVTGKMLPDPLSTLSGGVYELETTSPSDCATGLAGYQIIGQETVTAIFDAPASATLQGGTVAVTFTNNSANAVSVFWTFDQAGNNSSLFSPVHTYTVPGNYTVELLAKSATGCIDTARRTIGIRDDIVTNLTHAGENSCIRVERKGDQYIVRNTCHTALKLNLSDGNGRIIRSVDLQAGGTYVLDRTVDTIPGGIYYLASFSVNGRSGAKLVFY